MANAADLRIRITADGTQAIQGLNQVNGALQRHAQAAAAAQRHAAALRGAFVGMAQAAAAAVGVGAMAQAFIQANIESERLVKGLTAIAGSSARGAQELAYVKAQADRLGISVNALGTSYVSLLAATKNTTMEGAATRKIFESVSLAMAKLGKSSADAQGALTAIQQSISKQKVSAEELTQQLGERLPGATKAFADSLGVTTAELMEMMSRGDLTIEMWERFAAQLNKIYDDGQAIGGLDKEWNRLTNAIDRMMVAADNASGAIRKLGAMLQWATGRADALAEALQVIANWQAGKGFAYGERDDLASDFALRAKLLDQYVVKMKDAQAYLDASDLDTSAARRAEGEALIARINEIDARIKTVRADVKTARSEAESLSQRQAAGVGDDMVARWEAHNAAVAKNAEELAKLNGKYDASIAKKAEYAKMEVAVAEAVKLGTLTHAQGQAQLAAFAAAQDQAAASSRSHAQALSAEAQVVAQVEQKYGLMKGQLDAVWQMESSRGKGAGIGTKEWVKDLGRGHGHMTQLVGQFRMAAATAKGLGADMTTFNGQADAAGKYLAEAAAQGKTLWEQFAYYHGGPNEKNWGEQTRAYADAAVKLVATTGGIARDIGQNTGKAITDMLNQANAAVDSMIERYLPAEAATMAYAQAQQHLANSTVFAALSQEKQAIILQGLQKDLEKSQVTVSETATAWTEVWENAVKRIDDTFANLWEDLFSGGKSALASLKRAITSWLAEVAHALLTKPLVVAITASMTGGSGAAGATGTSSLGSLGNLASGLSSLFNWGGSALSSIFSGAVFSGISSGFGMAMSNISTAGFFGAFGANMSLAGSSFSMGAIGTAIGAAAPYLLAALPIAAIAVGVLAKYQKDQKPRVGAFAATTHGGVGQLEDSIGVAGGFGLTFGVNDKGSANIDAEEMRAAFEGFAKVSLALEQFYGADIAAEVEATLKQISNEHYAKTGILNYAMDMNAAFDVAFTQIIDAAAATGDSVAVVMKAVVGDLQGTTEAMAAQIDSAMRTTAAVVTVAKAMEGTDAAKILELGDDLTANALRLVDYARSLQWTGEELSATLERMALYLTGLDAALELTGTQTEATGQDFIDLARNLAYAADEAKIGMAGLIQLQNNYYQHFFTEEERALKIKEDSLKAIADWNTAQGLKGIDTSAELRAYIETLDLETEAGRAAYVEAMKITLAFIALDEALDKLGDTVIDVTDKFAAQRKSLRDLADRLDPTDPLSQEQRDSATDALRKAGYQGDLYDAQGLADFLRTLADLEDAGGKAGKDLQEFIDTFTGVFDELARIAEERSGLEMRLLELTGTKTQILAEKRRLEIEATDESNRALLRYIHTLEDAAAAAAEMASLTERLYAAAGDDAMVTQLQRQAELAEALSDGARAMLLMIYAIEDSAAAAEAANKQAEEAAQAANDAARAAFEARQEATREEYDAIRELVSTLQSLRNAIQSAIDAIFIDTPYTRISTRDEAQGRITAALLAARGGTLPDLDKLSPYLEVVSQNAESQFRTLEEYQRDAYRTRAELVELEALIGDRQTVEEQTLEALNTIINESFPESDANADQNADKIVVDVQRLIAIANAINEGVLRMDTDMDGLITFAEMRTALAGLATDPELRALFDMLDVNGDGILSALEAMPLKIAQNLTGMFDLLDTDLDGLLTFDELKAGLGPLATDEQIQAMMTMMDVNHDGLISEVEALRYQIISDSNILFAKIDTNGDKALTHDEFMAGVAGMASDEVLQGFWNSLDLNHDQLLTATEAIPLQIATSLSSYFDTLDSNTDGLLTYAELQSGLGGLATDYQIQQLIWAVDANGDGMISEQEAATFKLGALNTKADYQAQQLVALSYIATDIQKVDDNTANINYWQGEALGKFDVMIMWLHNIAQYTNLDYQNTARVAAHFTGYSFATGGIAEGPLSGYGATLHGREAVIPLGDGNQVVATLREPANYLPGVPDSAGLRAALAELQAELRAMRRDQQTIGATTAGELKEHNRRERRRDVVPQQVEVIS